MELDASTSFKKRKKREKKEWHEAQRKDVSNSPMIYSEDRASTPNKGNIG